MPAMPQNIIQCESGELCGSHLEDEWCGLTKREDFAARFMAAYRSQSDTLDVKPEEVAKWAIEDADALLKELEK